MFTYGFVKPAIDLHIPRRFRPSDSPSLPARTYSERFRGAAMSAMAVANSPQTTGTRPQTPAGVPANSCDGG